MLSAYDRWGASCPARLAGDFAVAICDPGERRVVLFRDRLGVKPLYYLSRAGVLASPPARRSSATCAAMPLARSGLGGWPPGRGPAEPDRDRLARGGQARPRLRARRRCRWRSRRPLPRVARRPALDHPEGPSSRRGVPGHARRGGQMPHAGADVIGTESSGGLDSSTVTALLARSSTIPVGGWSPTGSPCSTWSPSTSSRPAATPGSSTTTSSRSGGRLGRGHRQGSGSGGLSRGVGERDRRHPIPGGLPTARDRNVVLGVRRR